MTLPARRPSTTAVEAAGRVAGLARSLGVPADAIVAALVMPPARTAARVACLDCGHAYPDGARYGEAIRAGRVLDGVTYDEFPTEAR